MKRMLTILMLTPALAWAGENLLKNGDVAEVKDGKPASWTLKVETNAVAVCDVVADAARGNMLHVKYESGTGRALWTQGIAKADELIKPGKKYRVGFALKYKLDAAPPRRSGPNARVNFWNKEFKDLVAVHLTAEGNVPGKQFHKLALTKQEQDWTNVACVVTAPEGVARIAFYIANAGVAGEVWADNFVIEEVDDAAPEGPFLEPQ